MDTIAALKVEEAEISEQLVESQIREAQLLFAGEARTKTEFTQGVYVVR